MKKILVILLAAAIVLSLAACTSKKDNDETKGAPATDPATGTDTEKKPGTNEAPMAGGWTTNTDFGGFELTGEAAEKLKTANSDLVPVALLGAQVVAGMNYYYLCLDKGTLVTAEVYADLNGGAYLSYVNDITVPECFGGGLMFRPDDLCGAMEYGGAEGPGLQGDAEAAFVKATEGLREITHKPIALLGSQVAAGTNYAVLCCTTVKEGQAPELSVVTVYADLDGNATVTSVYSFVG